jgi:hypothetical protein
MQSRGCNWVAMGGLLDNTKGKSSSFFMCLESFAWCQGRSHSFQTSACNNCCFLATKSRDTNKNTNTQSSRTLSSATECMPVRFVPLADTSDVLGPLFDSMTNATYHTFTTDDFSIFQDF